VSLPELARAQQGGLFPLSPIRRQRVACDQELPIYKKIKYQYYGYYPTSWHPFPAGWGYPNPEAPDKAKSFRDQKLGAREEDQMELPPEGAAPARPEGGRSPVPPLPPGGRSPFEEPDTDKPGGAPAAPRGGQAPLDLPQGRDPFQLDKPANPPAAAPNAPRASRTRPTNPPGVSNGPELAAPAEDPDLVPGRRTSRNNAEEATDSQAEDSPLLALPNVNLPPVHDTTVFGTEPPPAVANTADSATNSTTSPGASPPRRGFLSGLFSNLGLNWTRR